MPGDGDDFIQACTMGTLAARSDGSFWEREKRGTYTHKLYNLMSMSIGIFATIHRSAHQCAPKGDKNTSTTAEH